MNKNFIVYLIAMALTTYLVRMIPFTFIRSKIKSKYLRDFLYYIPYSVLGAMTIPHIFYSCSSVAVSLAGALTAFILAYKKKPLMEVAIAACLSAYIAEFLLK